MPLRVTLGEVLVAAALATTTVVAVLPQAPVQAATGSVAAGWVVRVPVPDAIGGKTVIGQLTVDRATELGIRDGVRVRRRHPDASGRDHVPVRPQLTTDASRRSRRTG